MNDPRNSEQSNDRLIQLLQSDQLDSIPEEMLAELSDKELEEFLEARQAVEILDRFKPQQTLGPRAADQAEIESATMQLDATPAMASGKTTDAAAAVHRLGHYDVLETLGEGGFGVVVKARDTKLGRIVALKIAKLDLFSPNEESRERFAREARLVAMLSHPAIVPIFETGSDGAMLFIASAFCDGGTLSQWFVGRNKHVEPELAAGIVERLAEAAQHAHLRGVIHRDLKPGNVLLDFGDESRTDNGGKLIAALRITDFGLAKFESNDQAMTQTGATIGTPAYMSPEQARGAIDEIGTRADIYSLGAILYELLTGTPPIVRESHVATMRAIESENPQQPRRANAAIPPDLQAVCLKCLEKDPRHRYQHALELADDLRRFLEHKPVAARPVGLVRRLGRWSRRNPVVAAALSFAVLALFTGLAFSIAFGMNAERARIVANEKQQLAAAKSAEALTQAKLARQAVDRLQRAIADEPKFKSEGMEKFKLNLAAAARDFYQLVSTQRPNDPDVLREYVDTLKGLAYLQQLVGEHEDAAVTWEEAATIVREEFPEDLVGWAAIRSKLAEDLLLTGNTSEAVAITNDLVSRLGQAALESGSEDVFKNLVFQLVNAAQNLNHQGSPNQAEPLVDQAIELVNSITGQTPEQWPVSRNWARVLRCKTETVSKLGKHSEVDQFAPAAIGLYTQLMADQPERTSEALDSMATLHQSLGMSNQMRGQFEQAFEEFEQEKQAMQQLMQRHPDVAGLSFNWSNHMQRYASALVTADQIEQAEEMLTPHLDWLMQQQEKYPQLMHLLRITEVECRELMSRIDQHQGRPDDSQQQLDTAIAVCEQECESDQAPQGMRAFLGHLYVENAKKMLDNDEPESAAEWSQRAIEILEAVVEKVPVGDPAMYLQEARQILQDSRQRD